MLNIIKQRLSREYAMKKTALNKVEEENSEDTQVIRPIDLEDGAKLSPLHVAAIMGNKSKMVALLKDHRDDIDKGDKIGRTPLIFSILGDRYDCAEALLKAGADVNKTDVDERTALHWAAYQGNHRFIKLLLDKGAKQGCEDKEGRTPLHLSLSHDNIKVTSKLLKDADVDCRDGNGMTPLHFSVAYERVEHTKMLLHAKASPDCQDNDKKTVLHWAKTNKEMTIVQRLLDYERVMLILNTKDSDGRTALHLAVAADNKRLVRFLTSLDDCSLSELDHMHRTPLHWAAILGHTVLVEILLDRGADPLIPDKNGVRPLHYAAQNNFGKTVNAMLQHDNVKDVPDNDKRTALMWAAAKGAYDALSVFISHKQDILTADKAGATALHMAAEGGHLQCVSLLLQHQAGVNLLDKQQYTPLFCACQMGHKEVVESLLLHGAAVDLEDKEGRTPLHWAAVGGRTDICGMLLDHGLNPAKKDKLGRPALHYAAYSGFYTCMALLLEFRADVDARDNTGVTALHWACASGSLDAVKLLFRYNSFPNFVEMEGDKLTPLDYAIIREHQDVAQFMIEHSAFTIAGIQDEAATVIQAAWRGYSLRQAFQEQKQLRILHEKKRKQVRQKQDFAGSDVFSSIYTNEEQLLQSSRNKNKPFDSFATNGPYEEGNEKYFVMQPEFQEEIESQLSQGLLATDKVSKVSHGEYLETEFENDKFIDFFVKSMDQNDTICYSESDKDTEILSKDENTSIFDPSEEKLVDFGVKKRTVGYDEEARDVPSQHINHHHSNSANIGRRLEKKGITDNEEIICETDFATNDVEDKTIDGPNEDPSDKHLERTINNIDNTIVRSNQVRDNKYVRADERTNSNLKVSEDSNSVSKKELHDNKKNKGGSENSKPNSESALKPWQIYKRERQRAKLIRRKIESAVVIQRAVRKHLSKIRPNDSEASFEKNEKTEGKDEIVLAEIAALMIQLHWRKYLKNKLLKDRVKAKEKNENEDQRIYAAREKKPKVILHPLTPDSARDSSRPQSQNSEIAPLRLTSKGKDNSDPVTVLQPRKSSNARKTHESSSQMHRKSRPKTVGAVAGNEKKPAPRNSETQIKSGRYKANASRGSHGSSNTHTTGLKMYMPQSWSSNLQKFPLRY